MTRWWINNRGEMIGPIPEDLVLMSWQQGRIAPDASACVEGTEQWLPLSHVPLIAARIHGLQSPGTAARQTSRVPRVPIWLLLLGGLIGIGLVGRLFGARPADPYPTSSHHKTAKAKTTEEPLPDLTKPIAEPAAKGVPPPKPEADWVFRLAAIATKNVPPSPKEVLWNYMDTGMDRYFFDFAPLGEVELSKHRTKKTQWEVIVPLGAASPADFAPSGGLQPLVSGNFAWWRITEGSFAGHFLFRSLGSIEVRSKAEICEDAAPSLPAVRAACN